LRKKENPTETGRSKETRATWPLLAGLVLSVLLVAVSCGGMAGEQRADDPAEDEPQAGAEWTQSGPDEEQTGVDLENPSLGSESAPVVMIEYADYQ
jgi:hypothetical protein